MGAPRTVFFRLTLLASALISCKGDDGTTPLADGGTAAPRDASPVDSGPGDTGPIDSGELDAGMMPADAGFDGNDGFNTARPVPFGSQGARGTINPAGDHDFFVFDGDEGSWLQIVTVANPGSQPGAVDTVITLYDERMDQIAENDDAIPRVSPDSEIMVRLPATGRYFVEVQEFSDWAGETPEGASSFNYELIVRDLNPASNRYIADDTEVSNDAADAAPVSFVQGASYAVGTFRNPSDKDPFRVTVSGTETQSFRATVMPAGPTGYGSTTPPGNMWITGPSGQPIFARVDTRTGLQSITGPLAPGAHVLWIEHAGTSTGTNDFYVLKLSLGTENPLETMDATNGTPAGAEPLPLEDAGAMVRRGFILATLGPSDVDYFAFDVRMGERASVACGSQSLGSGVRGLRAQIRDRADAVLAMATETSTAGLDIIGATFTSTGTHYLRLDKSGQDPMVTGEYVRCGVAAFVPTE